MDLKEENVMLNMLRYICFTLMAGIIIYLNVRGWNMTQAESFVDPVNWGGVIIVGLIGGFLVWKQKN